MVGRRLENVRERLQDAALSLFARQGLDGTTVAEIVAAAGVSERTFFRHFADKREVIFWGQETFQQRIVEAVNDAPLADPTSLLAAALAAAAAPFPQERRPRSLARRAVIDADSALRERELLKFASLAEAISVALRRRGVESAQADVAAHAAVAIFGVSFTLWLADGELRSLAEMQATGLADLRAVLCPSSASSAAA